MKQKLYFSNLKLPRDTRGRGSLDFAEADDGRRPEGRRFRRRTFHHLRADQRGLRKARPQPGHNPDPRQGASQVSSPVPSGPKKIVFKELSGRHNSGDDFGGKFFEDVQASVRRGHCQWSFRQFKTF